MSGLDKLDRAAAEWARQESIARFGKLEPPDAAHANWLAGILHLLQTMTVEELVAIDCRIRIVVIEQRRQRQEMARLREERNREREETNI